MSRCAVVTGGARGIGASIVARLRDEGCHVTALDLAEPEGQGPDRFVRVDLSDAEAARTACNAIAAEGPVDCLVNNVGIVAPAPLESVELEDLDRLFHINLRPSLIAAQAFVPGMKAAGQGRIVMNNSRVTLGKELRSLYSATKGAAQSMARTWALELAPFGITVNCVSPGPIATEAFWQNNPPDSPRTHGIIDKVPMRRMGSGADVAQAVAFFCDERSGFITGQTVYVCGGVTVGLAGT
ncbi:SDR family oxidoreductase [Agrobacterium genomosp. 3]|uniref:SDR family NAD(P)-dependent oxidoreductase n=1 Tax=Agrobacterium tomkonis TaxID=1183410 RepID=UPI001CD9157D|nr:SDR family oxidoreductase [Agrobacterium tomkonis]MCA1879309.1 SDR family oxidoreductase [Agrobacterium tumefaciens]MCA1894472.1 SDR family oxidoreductase [Agrobacterium tomkonis]